MKAALILLFCGVILLSCDLNSTNYKQSEEITLYFEACPEIQYNPYSCPVETHLWAVQYMVSIPQQIVVPEMLAFGFERCRVFSKNVWQCYDSYGLRTYLNGTYYQQGDHESTIGQDGKSSHHLNLMTIPKHRYYLKKFWRFITNRP